VINACKYNLPIDLVTIHLYLQDHIAHDVGVMKAGQPFPDTAAHRLGNAGKLLLHLLGCTGNGEVLVHLVAVDLDHTLKVVADVVTGNTGHRHYISLA